jgi:hypothetical protein
VAFFGRVETQEVTRIPETSGTFNSRVDIGLFTDLTDKESDMSQEMNRLVEGRVPKKDVEPKPRDREKRSDDDGCKMIINVDSKGTINIYNCPPAQEGGPKPPRPPEECPPPPHATGACIPLAPGSKHKSSLQAKLRPLIENSPVPSVLAATLLQQTRRFQLGRSPGNDLEASVFEVLDSISRESPEFLSCFLDSFAGLTKGDRESIFSPEILGVGDEALSEELIADLFTKELEVRAADALLGDDACVEEKPGIPRPVFSVINGGAFLGFLPSICRVNGLRTVYFNPALGVGDYEPEEFEQTCTPEVVDGEVRLNCEVQTEDCPGHVIAGPNGTICLRVPEVNAGDSAVLEGINFFNVEATVRLQAKAPGTASAEVAAFVCGDQETPASEEINGVNVPINDCRVHDRLTFQIPEELPVGIYEVRVVVPNNTGVEDTDPVFTSNEVFVRVMPPDTAVFQIASETLRAEEETSPAWFGSDEVGLRFLAIPIFSDLTLGSVNEVNFRFGDVDSGDSRDISRVLIQESGLAGVSIGVIGFEIDSEDAFEKQIDNFTDAFIDMLKRVWEAIKDKAKEAVVAIVKKFGIKGLIAVLIAAVVLIVVIAIVALWAPADLIIEDTIALSSLDLAMLTNANFPAPPEQEFTTNGDIDVKVVPVSKDVQYRERREYESDDEDSEYHITLRYNRLS